MSVKSILTRLGCWTIALFFLTSSLAAGAGTPDVGLVTDLSGEVTYWNPGEKQAPTKAQAFLKIREGDRFKLPAGALLQLTYFAGGRQETWRGLGTVEVGDQAGRSVGKELNSFSPEVKVLAVKVAKCLAGTPVAVSRATAQGGAGCQVEGGELRSSGVIQTMGPKPALAPAAVPRTTTERDSKEVAEAEKTYHDLKKQASPGDLTPEIYLLGVYADHGEYGKMEQLLDIMLAQRPQEAHLRKLKAWAHSQASRKE